MAKRGRPANTVLKPLTDDLTSRHHGTLWKRMADYSNSATPPLTTAQRLAWSGLLAFADARGWSFPGRSHIESAHGNAAGHNAIKALVDRGVVGRIEAAHQHRVPMGTAGSPINRPPTRATLYLLLPIATTAARDLYERVARDIGTLPPNAHAVRWFIDSMPLDPAREARDVIKLIRARSLVGDDLVRPVTRDRSIAVRDVPEFARELPAPRSWFTDTRARDRGAPPMSLETVIQLVQNRMVLPDTLLHASDGAPPVPAGDVRELASTFAALPPVSLTGS